jgi:pyruvate dehydrogenase E2 component (dihydrolipoamide acetyltransferase)
MATQIKLPNLGENIESGDVLSILVSEGESVRANQDLLEIETDKATMPIPAPESGTIVKILVSEGDTISVGAPIMEIEASASRENGAEQKLESRKQDKAAPPAKPKKSELKEEPATVAEEPREEEQPVPPSQPAKPAATKPVQKKAAPPMEVVGDVPGDGHASAAAGPAVRRLARQLGVDLRRVRPSGESGRITAEDVRAHVRETNEQVAARLPRGVTPPGSPDTDDFGGVRVEKMSRMRQTIARNMIQSYTTIPQLTNFDDVDVTELEEMREQSKRDYSQMPFLIKAVASALRRHPIINASVDMESNHVIYKEYVNIGVAVDTDRGLVVPVIRDADRKSISQLAAELDELATEVREGQFDLDLTKGGTFTISNLGSVGGTYSTPIINPPEVAILLVGRSRVMPQIVGDTFEPRLMMPLSITYDHRLVDGAAAARFLNEVKSYLSAPGRLLLAP